MLLLTAIFTAEANPVDMRTIREVAVKFVNANAKTPLRSADDLQLVTTYNIDRGDAAFHIFNTPNGYVIVSADDCATPILAYSDEDQFDPNNLPEAMQAYLMGFVEQIQYGIEHHLQADEQTARQWELVQTTGRIRDHRATTSVSPLLSDTWDQNCYYNNLCPTDSDGPCGHVYVGCTATSMGQIMHYWGYPTTGSGSMTYTPTSYPQQSVNFASTTYQWSDMPNSLSSSSSSTQINAVATLLWHCSVALQAEYGPYGTSGMPSRVPNVLINNFKYSSDLYGAYMSDYSNDTWLSMVKASIDEGRPIHYSGWDSEGGGGHSFVCDGYDANDYLHFNWGWSGYGNSSYFALGALVVSGYDFSYDNYAVFNIYPNCFSGTTFQVTATASPLYGGIVSGTGSFSCGDECTLTATPFDGYNFVNWTQNGTVVSSSATCTLTIESNMDLVANFSDGLVGDGGTTSNAYLPSYSFYRYSLTQQIYTASELGEAGNINSIAFYNSGPEKTRSYDFYLKTTTKSDFSSGTDWETVSASDLVFSGSVTMAAGGWTVITFDTPFYYDGQSNLVLVTDDNTGSYTGSPHMQCRVFDANRQTIRLYSDGTDYDPFNSGSYNGTIMNVKNQLLITKDTPAPIVQVFAEYYPDANDPQSPYVKVRWGTDLTYIEDFERGDFSMFDWHLDPTYPWEITTTNPYEGNYCMMSGNYNVASSTSAMEAKVRVPNDGQISFFSKISSESNWDFGYFYIDGVRYASCSGDGTWEKRIFNVTAGMHTFKWAYTKDGSVNKYDDRFYVDYITFYVPTTVSTTYDFEEGMGDWTTIDADGDGFVWENHINTGSGNFETHSGDGCMVSGSYDATAGALTPDNYLVSPRIELGGSITFWACAQDANWPSEHFGVAVSTTGNTDAADFTTIAEWTLTAKSITKGAFGMASRSGNRAPSAYYEYTVDLSAYSGQGYVAIRHFNCTDWFYLNVDDITIGVPDAKSVASNDRTLSNYRVYRANCDGSGIQMIADNVTQNYYIDTDWAALAMGSYKYGISTFSIGRESAISWVETENGNTQPLTLVEAEAMGIELSPTAAQAPMDGNPSGYRATWDLLGSYSCTSGYQYGVATDGQYIYHSAWTSNAGFMFAKYDMQGNFIETFDVAGCGYLRDLTYDGQYFYGGAAGSVLYCVDLANQTLISTTTTSCSAIRYCAYDPARDGFWVGDWSTAIKFIDRSGTTLITGPNGVSFAGAAYYRDKDDVEHIYFFAQPDSDALIYDYNIAANTLSSLHIFDVCSNLSGATGFAGGCFIGEYKGKMALFADVQQDPNMVGIFELKDASAWSNCIDKEYVGQAIELTQGWNWISTYIDLNEVDGVAMLEEALGDYGVTIQTYNESADYFGDGEWSGLEDYEWTNAEMVMVEVSEDCTIDLAGPTVDPGTVEIEIHPGWNWIGFPVATETAIGVAMAGFEAEEEDAIQSNVDGTSDYLDEWLGDVLTLVPGQGYMYYSNSTEPKTLVFQTGHDYVDLGLPSGTLWATCNVGAEIPEDYGDYFAWGETQPKNWYDWSTYQYCNGSENTLTKYCSNSSCGYNGFTDDLTILLPEDDAATANWGGNWRMPTKEEWQELYNNTTMTWTTQNGVSGMLFTASNGNSLFLPAAGCIMDDEYQHESVVGLYWSSSLSTDYPKDAWYFYFEPGNYGMDDFHIRYFGQSVRPVRSRHN